MINYFGSINTKFINLVGVNRKTNNKLSKDTQFKTSAYDKMPNKDEYVRQYINLMDSDNAICCRVCSSQDIKDWGLLSRDDNKRVHSCNCCGQILWRSRDSI